MALEYLNPLNLSGMDQAAEDTDMAFTSPVAAAYRYLLQPYGGQGADMQTAQLYTPTVTTQTGGGMQGYDATQGMGSMMQAPGTQQRIMNASSTMYPGGTQGFDESTGRYTNAAASSGAAGSGTAGSGDAALDAWRAQNYGQYRSSQDPNAITKLIATPGGGSAAQGALTTNVEQGAQTDQTQQGSTRGAISTATSSAAADQAAIDAQNKYNAELQANLYKKPEYGENINFDRRYPNNWGPVTGTLEDRIFRQFGDLTGRYTTAQISADEVKSIADKVRAGTIKESDVGSVISAAENARKAAATTEKAADQPSALDVYFQKPKTYEELTNLQKDAKYETVQSPWGPMIRSGSIGVALNDRGEPGQFIFYDREGKPYTSGAFYAEEFLRNASKFKDINPLDLLGVEKGLQANNIGYLPYQQFKGTGSDHGIDFKDLLSGGTGSAYDWTSKKDRITTNPYSMFYSPFAESQYAETDALANKYGLKYNQDKYKGGGIDPNRFTQLQGGDTPARGWVVYNGNSASWYNTQAEAKEAQTKMGGTVIDLSKSPITNLDKPGGAAGGGFYVEDGQGHFGQRSPLDQMDRFYSR